MSGGFLFNIIERDEKYKNVIHQNDVWHGGKNIAKKVNTISYEATIHQLNNVYKNLLPH